MNQICAFTKLINYVHVLYVYKLYKIVTLEVISFLKTLCVYYLLFAVAM